MSHRKVQYHIEINAIRGITLLFYKTVYKTTEVWKLFPFSLKIILKRSFVTMIRMRKYIFILESQIIMFQRKKNNQFKEKEEWKERRKGGREGGTDGQEGWEKRISTGFLKKKKAYGFDQVSR